jgi:hypothetical protein
MAVVARIVFSSVYFMAVFLAQRPCLPFAPLPLLRAPCGMLCLPRWLAARSALPLFLDPDTAVGRCGAGFVEGDGRFIGAGLAAGLEVGRCTSRVP